MKNSNYIGKNVARKMIIYLSCLFILSACRNDFLEIHDKTSLGNAYFPENTAQLNLLLNGLYAKQHQYNTYSCGTLGRVLYLLDHNSDLAWTGDVRSEYARNNASAPNSFMLAEYGEWVSAVKTANVFLEAVEKYRKTKIRPDETAYVDYLQGQGLFLRAFLYWHLMLWAQPDRDGLGHVIYETLVDSWEEIVKPRSSTGQTWDFIINDLKEASRLCTGYNSELGRVSEWAAKAFLAKAYAYAGDWTNAKTALEDVVLNSGKRLAPFERYSKKMFHGEDEFNEESLWEIDLTVDHTVSGMPNAYSVGSSHALLFPPYYVGPDGGQATVGWPNNFVHDRNLPRFGFTLGIPTRQNNPAYDPNKEVNTQNMDKICDASYIQQSLNFRRDKTTDPRLYVATLQPFVDSLLVSGVWRYIHQYKGDGADFVIPHHAWSHWKYGISNGQLDEVYISGNNIIFLRLADIYLLYAEALIETGNATGGLEYINKVHRRAYGYDDYDTPTSIDYVSLTDRTKALAEDHLANDPLKYERWAELFGEGQWWWDVKRWKIGKKEADYFTSTTVGPIEWGADDHNYALPYPADELRLNPAIEQNPGYK
jgi:hypothetical protein